MIKELIFAVILFTYLGFVCECHVGSGDKSGSAYKSAVSTDGKVLFYENCSQCHTPRFKDGYFIDYVSKTEDLSDTLRGALFKQILKDSNHINRNIPIFSKCLILIF